MIHTAEWRGIPVQSGVITQTVLQSDSRIQSVLISLQLEKYEVIAQAPYKSLTLIYRIRTTAHAFAPCVVDHHLTVL